MKKRIMLGVAVAAAAAGAALAGTAAWAADDGADGADLRISYEQVAGTDCPKGADSAPEADL
ncbi:hypothetical protein Ais01nite_45460 [Asanoa ishikariensis]|uniref:Uncharacterized protein n=1 Tax=Asanoa ishikariensis TaxID=137265 RepID=A0A1H3S454_9ACTN|nr:hypothetical protein [Asanoa ishikariensis]GIF66511.1 hypothetical protein Ais01nite_45460 [Asanoa ishikariensis]SDZ32712.1 hypothetical protein SAMN05421684_4535 [Asanoa ishikariensis]